MRTLLSHAEVFRTAARSGQMIRSLYGQPGLVIGLARSGIAPALAFTEGSGAAHRVVLKVQRPSSNGYKGQARSLWTRYVPSSIRQLYKLCFFALVTRLSDACSAERTLTDAQFAELSAALAQRGEGPVVIVDDAIDSGGTLSAVVKAIKALAPQANLITFALASTLGRVITHQQFTLVSGHIAHFVDGDLAKLDVSLLFDGPVVSSTGDDAAIPTQELQMYLDLDGTLTRDSFRDAVHSLARLYWRKRMLSHGVGLSLTGLFKKARLINHRCLKKHIDRRIGDLNSALQAEYFDDLSIRLRAHARPAVWAAATAPHVNAAIVTAALKSYAAAIEQAFNLPVISGSGPNATGAWHEVGSDDKITAIEKFRSKQLSGRSIMIGDTLTDALALAASLNVVTIPRWDKTGLSTLLGLSSWWQLAQRATPDLPWLESILQSQATKPESGKSN